MQNDYGVYKGNIDAGTAQWVKSEMPLTFGTAAEAIHTYSFAEAITVSDYLTQTEGEVFSFGRPDDRHGTK